MHNAHSLNAVHYEVVFEPCIFVRLWWSATTTSPLHNNQYCFQHIGPQSSKIFIRCCIVPCCDVIRYPHHLLVGILCENRAILTTSTWFCSANLNLHSFTSITIHPRRCNLEPLFRHGQRGSYAGAHLIQLFLASQAGLRHLMTMNLLVSILCCNVCIGWWLIVA